MLGHAEVDNMDYVRSFRVWSPDQEVIGLDVSVNQVLFVNRLDARKLQQMLAQCGWKMETNVPFVSQP